MADFKWVHCHSAGSIFRFLQPQQYRQLICSACPVRKFAMRLSATPALGFRLRLRHRCILSLPFVQRSYRQGRRSPLPLPVFYAHYCSIIRAGHFQRHAIAFSDRKNLPVHTAGFLAI
ncbi:MAG: hypothetical protein KDJ29_03060 [Hyphomicrobiales bacterium]|nr:hypothetical protein [Hyphomicrobiales bacterium]